MKLNDNPRFRMPEDNNNGSDGPQVQKGVHIDGKEADCVLFDPNDEEQRAMISLMISSFCREGCKQATADFCSGHKLTMDQGVRLWSGFSKGQHPMLMDMIYNVSSRISQFVSDLAESGDGSKHLHDTAIVAQAKGMFDAVFKEKASDLLDFAHGKIALPEGFSPAQYLKEVSADGPVQSMDQQSEVIKNARKKLRNMLGELME